MRNSTTERARLEWHLEYNFLPPLDARLALPCQQALEALRAGEPDRIIPINGATSLDGCDLTAQKIAEDMRLEDFL